MTKILQGAPTVILVILTLFYAWDYRTQALECRQDFVTSLLTKK